MERFIRRETANYAREAWILKLDIKGFFMSIDRGLLFARLEEFLRGRYHERDREIVYVDDFVIIHPDRRLLAALIPVIGDFLLRELRLTLHPRKVYLQPARRGVEYLGVLIKPGRTIIANRTKGNFAAAVELFNRLAEAQKPSAADQARFQSSINSYLGILRHYATGRLRRVMLGRLSPLWWRQFRLIVPQKSGPPVSVGRKK